MKPGLHRVFALAATLAVVGAVVWGFVIVGSPDARRQQRLDERRVEALQAIQREIQELLVDPDVPGVLRAEQPQTLQELATRARMRKIEPDEPETGQPYSYRVLTKSTYELSATFARPRDARREVFWNHPAGEHTFTIDAGAAHGVVEGMRVEFFASTDDMRDAKPLTVDDEPVAGTVVTVDAGESTVQLEQGVNVPNAAVAEMVDASVPEFKLHAYRIRSRWRQRCRIGPRERRGFRTAPGEPRTAIVGRDGSPVALGPECGPGRAPTPE